MNVPNLKAAYINERRGGGGMKANEVFDDAAMSDKDLEELLRLEL